MKGQDVMTSNVACHAILWTENSNEHPKTRDQQKHDIESHKTGWFDHDHDQDHHMDHDSSERLNFFDL